MHPLVQPYSSSGCSCRKLHRKALWSIKEVLLNNGFLMGKWRKEEEENFVTNGEL